MSHFPRPFLRIIKGLSRATHKTANRTGNKQILLKCVSKLEDDHSKKLKSFLILGRGLIFAASLKQNRQFPVNFQSAHSPFESLYDSSFKSGNANISLNIRGNNGLSFRYRCVFRGDLLVISLKI